MGPVEINQPLANDSKGCERRRRTIDELSICTRKRHGSFQEKLALVTRLKTVLIDVLCEGSPEFRHIKNGLNRCSLGSGAKEIPVRSLAKEQLKCPKQNRFSGTRLP